MILIKMHKNQPCSGYMLVQLSVLAVLLLSLVIQICSANQTNLIINKNDREDYQEMLFFRPLQDGKLFAQFQFKTTYRGDMKSLRWENKFELFPLSIAEVVSIADLSKLHFSLTKGNWNYRQWGYSNKPAPPGAQIRVNFSEHNKTPAKSWNRLVNLLSGKFCTSLTAADDKTRVTSKLAFQNQFRHASVLTSETYYANLPEETLCTENLTPWKKLLPCPMKAGLTSLLNSQNILKTSYSSLAIDLEPVKCLDPQGVQIPDCEKAQLTQTFSLVFNPLLQFEGRQTWSIIKLFGNGIKNICPLASSTRVHVDITDLDDVEKLYPKIHEEQEVLIKTSDTAPARSIKYATYFLNSNQGEPLANISFPFNVGIKQKSIFKFKPSSERPLLPVDFRTNMAGMGSIDGTMIARISNSLDEPVTVTYMDIVPHFLRLYLHTLKIISTKTTREIEPKELVFNLSEGDKPTLIEITLDVPANDEVQIYYDLERSFLRWTDYKPDANKGVIVGSASLRVSYCCKCLARSVMPITSHLQLNASSQTRSCSEMLDDQGDVFRLYARPLLIIQPTPDFSMAYNVICLVCTVLVAGFGPIHNLTTRRYQVVSKSSTIKHESEVKDDSSAIVAEDVGEHDEYNKKKSK